MQNQIESKNKDQVKKWYTGIQAIFEHIQVTNKWSKEEAWDKLKVELIDAVGARDLVPDDLEWVRGLLVYGKKPTT